MGKKNQPFSSAEDTRCLENFTWRDETVGRILFHFQNTVFAICQSFTEKSSSDDPL